jgi:hypothetical protein
MPEKVDRLYVDALLRDVEESVNDHITETLTDHYAEISLDIQNAFDMIGTMREHFVRSLDSFKSELIRFRKKLTDDMHTAAEERTKTDRPVGRLPPRSTFLKNNIVTVPQICRTTPRKRTQPFVPRGLDKVIGKAIAPITSGGVDYEDGSA